MKRLASGLAAVAILACLGQAQAAPIVYSFTGVGTGHLGPIAFTDGPFTILGYGDTSQIGSLPPPPFQTFAAPVTVFVTVDGVTGNLFNGFPPFIESFPGVGVIDFATSTSGSSHIVIIGGNFPLSYDLSQPIGPVSGTPFFQFNQTYPTYFPHISLAFSANLNLAFGEADSGRERSLFAGFFRRFLAGSY